MPRLPSLAPSPLISRRRFLSRSAAGAAVVGMASAQVGGATLAAAGEKARGQPVRMVVGHQHDHSELTLRALAAFGVKNICSGKISRKEDDGWSVDGLTRLRKHVESFGLSLDCVPLPLSAAYITQSEHPEIMLARDPERDRALDDFCQMIRNCGRVGIPMVKYNLTFLGVVRTAAVPGRGGAIHSAFDFTKSPQMPALTEAGRITDEIYWERIAYFLKRVVPVAEEAKVRIACHPQDPGMPRGTGWRGVNTVLGATEGLRRFVELQANPYHGLNFCQGTVAEMLEKPGEEIYDVIREFGRRGKIFNVHFRNIRGGFLKFEETFPDDGDVDMPRALRAYREVGYAGMIMPDHVPQVMGDVRGQKAYAFCFGYIQALLQVLRAEA